eukprot:SAG22_NODE_54_length_23787_cov_12.917511_14_plen_264_part_00
MEADNQGDAAHFLGQQDFGKAVIFLNMVATVVSGYVVVGVPDLANALGFASLGFLTVCTTAGSMTPFWAKICRISKARVSVPVLIEYEWGGFSGVFGTDATQDNCDNYAAVKTVWPEVPPVHRRTWVLENKTPDDVVEWMRSLPAPFNQYTKVFEEHGVDGPGLANLSLQHMKEMAIDTVGHRYTMQRLITEYVLKAEQDLYVAGTFNASQAELDFVAGNAAAGTSELDFESTLNPSSASRKKDPAMSASMLADTDRMPSADM